MASFPGELYQKLLRHRYGLRIFIFLAASALTGAACVLFMRAFEWVLHRQLNQESIGAWCWLTTPLLFMTAILLIRYLAPKADGAGIPQTIFAAKYLNSESAPRLSSLVSFRTMSVKILALLIAVWAGASTGREGPTVHVAACLFFGIVYALHKLFKLPFDMRSAVVAWGAAGLAAAFNTPLAGVTFAIEELSSDYFASMKDAVLMAIIVAGLAAKSLTGEYLYFGHMGQTETVSFWAMLAVGFSGGALGALFSTALLEGRRYVLRFQGWKLYVVPVLLAWALLAVAAFSHLKGILGPGNLAAQDYIQGDNTGTAGLFLISKISATLFTYWSGIAGGIFAPCLSMGSAVGALLGPWLHSSVSACAVIGMAAFLSGAIQAPITAFVIIFEMTGRHQMLLPIMLASLVGFMTARFAGAKHLYQALASFYAVPEGRKV